MGPLSDKVAVVTGAGSGIGKAVALELARCGAVLCIAGRRLEALERVAGAAPGGRDRVQCRRVDLALDDEVEAFAASVRRDFGRVDILVHSAGAIALGKLESASVDQFDTQFRINVRAPYKLTQVLLPMLKSACGQIVFVNSSAGVTARANVGQYAATKHALKAVSDSLREEVNEYGIRVVSVYPGRTATPMQAGIYASEGKDYEPGSLLQAEDVAAQVVQALSLPRTAEVTDIHIRPMVKPAGAK